VNKLLEFLSVNWLAVLVAAVAQMIVGFIWFSPALFGKTWMVLHGIDPNSSEQVQQMRKHQGKIFPLMFIMTW